MNSNRYTLQVSFYRPNLQLRVVMKDGRDSFDQLLAYLEAQDPAASGIVYCLSREESENVAR